MFKNLRELIASMPDESQCREYLIEQRWPDGKVACVYCDCDKVYRIKERSRFICASKECGKKFSVTVGTVFEDSKIPLVKWFTAMYISTAHKKGISSYQLGKDIGVSQKCAWFMLHRLREVMRDKVNIKLDNIVEVDEVHLGGKVGNMSKTKRKELRETGMSMNTKTMVIGMVERLGYLKLITIGKSYKNMDKIQPTVIENVDSDAVVITDSMGAYTGIDKTFAGHEIVNHSEMEYVKDGAIHTNTIEGAFSLLKRSIYGIYHQCTPKHLSRYCDETMYRYNLRKMTDAQRFIYSLQRVEGRLTYKNLIQKSDDITELKPISFAPKTPRVKTSTRGRKGKPVQQIKDGQIIATFPSAIEAEIATGVRRHNICKVAKGLKHHAGGFNWKFA